MRAWVDKHSRPLAHAAGVGHWSIVYDLGEIVENDRAQNDEITLMRISASESYWNAAILIETREQYRVKTEKAFVDSLIHEFMHLHLAPIDVAFDHFREMFYGDRDRVSEQQARVQASLERSVRHAVERSVRNLTGLWQTRTAELPEIETGAENPASSDTRE